MKYFVSVLIILAVIGGYCFGTLDKKPIDESYQPPMNLELVILNMKVARDSHKRWFVADPVYEKWLNTWGSSVEKEGEWVRLYDMTLEILESLRKE